MSLSHRIGKDEIKLKKFLDDIVAKSEISSFEPYQEEIAVLNRINERFMGVTKRDKEKDELMFSLAAFCRYAIEVIRIQDCPEHKEEVERAIMHILRNIFEYYRSGKVERETNRTLS